MTPNSVDGILFFILFVFAFLAFLKGFVREFFSTLNLIIALIISYVASPFITKLFVNVSAPQMLIDLGTQFVVFVAVLIICSILSAKVSHPLSEKMPDFLNQSLGFGFGFVKGYLIISFAFAVLLFFYSGITSDDAEVKIKDSKKVEKFGPEWFKNSRSYDILDFGATLLQPMVKDMLSGINGNNDNQKKSSDGFDNQLDAVKKIIKTQKVYDKLLQEENNPSTPDDQDVPVYDPKEKDDNTTKKDESGYTDQEVKKMKRLIEIMSN